MCVCVSDSCVESGNALMVEGTHRQHQASKCDLSRHRHIWAHQSPTKERSQTRHYGYTSRRTIFRDGTSREMQVDVCSFHGVQMTCSCKVTQVNLVLILQWQTDWQTVSVDFYPKDFISYKTVEFSTQSLLLNLLIPKKTLPVVARTVSQNTRGEVWVTDFEQVYCSTDSECISWLTLSELSKVFEKNRRSGHRDVLYVADNFNFFFKVMTTTTN